MADMRASDQPSSPEALAEPVAAPAPVPVRPPHLFQPGRAKTGGRRRGTPNRVKSYTVARILELSDPITILARIANGEPFELAPEPGKPPATVYPTMSDMLQAAIALARKVAPDLKAVKVEDSGNVVNVYLQLRQQTTVEQPGK